MTSIKKELYKNVIFTKSFNFFLFPFLNFLLFLRKLRQSFSRKLLQPFPRTDNYEREVTHFLKNIHV